MPKIKQMAEKQNERVDIFISKEQQVDLQLISIQWTSKINIRIPSKFTKMTKLEFYSY